MTAFSHTTLADPNVSMCQVEDNGLGGPDDGGPPEAGDADWTACSCSKLVRSVTDPSFLHVLMRLETTLFDFSSLVDVKHFLP